MKAASFSPLKGTAAGLGIILQIIDDETNRGENFLYILRRIEFQAAVITENPTYDLNSEMTRNLVEEKSRDLTAAIVGFFNSALVYLSTSFPGNLAKSITLGTKWYEDAQKNLDIAIREYDQAVLNLAARVVASLKYEQDIDRKEERDAKFLKWLSPSHWLVEAQLHSFRQQRGEETLRWARDMKEFHDWRLSDSSCNDRILWIRGTLGIGKSTMAGYLIDLLKCHYPTSIVAYFFCRSNEAGLTKARDIIRTLAYQCIDSDSKAFVKLETLRTSGFIIEDRLGVRFLFEKLVREPLQTSTKDVFIIVDGLDEADLTTIDATDRSEKTEMYNLLKCLTRLSNARLLFFSRPTANIAAIIPTIVKSIGMAENREDINAYVVKTIAESTRLQKFFEDEQVDAIKYFDEKANGIFLWVVLVLQQLGNSKSRSIFRSRLNGFSDASGSMDKLYTSVLSRIEEDDKVWITEILRWLVVGEQKFQVSVLQKAVEWSIQDSLADFRGFLEVECGSILHLLPSADGSDQLVQLVHETFRSFLLNSKKCPTAFLIDEKAAHGEVALACLSNLLEADASGRSTYASSRWVMHLSKASTWQSPQLLTSLLNFLDSEGMQLWMKDIVCHDRHHPMRAERTPWETNIGESHFEGIVQWLQCCQSLWQTDTGAFGELWQEAKAILRDPFAKVGKCFGTAACALWLTENLSCSSAEVCFSVALKHYLGREGQCASILKEVRGLSDTGFEGLSEWACGRKTKQASRRNLGIAYYSLQRWDDCIRYMEVEETDEDAASALRYLGQALMAKGDYDGAIKVFWRVAEMRCDPEIWFRPGLLDAYEAKGDYEAAIHQFQYAANRDYGHLNPKICLGYAYLGKGEYDVAIKLFERFPSDKYGGWVDYGLCEAYMMNRDYHGGIDMLTAGRGDLWLREVMLPKMYYGAGDYERLIKVLAEDNDFPWSIRFKAYAVKGDADSAIREFERAIGEDRALDRFHFRHVLDQYKTTKDVKRAIKMFNRIEERSSSRYDYWTTLVEAYTCNREYDLAITTFEKALAEFRSDGLIHSGLMAYRDKGDFDGAFKLLQCPKGIDRIGILTSYGIVKLCEVSKDYDQAIHIFESVIEMQPLEPWVWHTLGELHTAKRDYMAAICTYQAAARHISVDLSFQVALGKVYLANSSHRDAICAFNAAINKARSKSILFAYLNTRPINPRDDCIPIAIDADFENHFLWYSLAKVYAASSDEENANNIYNAAIDEYQVALRKRTRDTLFWQYEPHISAFFGLFDVFRWKQPLAKQALWSALALAYQCKGLIPEAKRAFRRALMLEQNNLWLRNIVNKLGASSEPGDTGCPFNGEGPDETQPAREIFEKRRTEGTLIHLRQRDGLVKPVTSTY